MYDGEVGNFISSRNFDISRPTFHLFNALLTDITCSGPCVQTAQKMSAAEKHGPLMGPRSKSCSGPRSASFSDTFGLSFLSFLDFAYKFV